MSDLQPFLDSRQYDRLSAECPDGRAIIWGKSSRDRVQWLEIETGDVVLFYHKMKYFERAEVAGTVQCAAGAIALWGERARDDDGRLPEYLIFYRNATRIALTAAKTNAALGYVSHYALRRVRVLNTEKSIAVRKLLEV